MTPDVLLKDGGRGAVPREHVPSIVVKLRATLPLYLHDDEPVDEKNDNDGVFTGEEHIRVAENVVFKYKQHSQHEEGQVLKTYRDDDAVHIRVTAAVVAGKMADGNEAAPVPPDAGGG